MALRSQCSGLDVQCRGLEKERGRVGGGGAGPLEDDATWMQESTRPRLFVVRKIGTSPHSRRKYRGIAEGCRQNIG